MQNSAAVTTPFTGDSRMRSMLGATLLALCALPLTVVAAAQAPNPVTNGVRAMAQRQTKYIVEAAEEMPADKYGYKPTPAQMSFGDVVAHLIQDAQLGDSIDFFGGRRVTKGMAGLITVADWADHYSQMAIYLRLNGLLPPTAKKASD